MLVAAADPPDGGPVTLQAGCHRLGRLTGGDGQDDPGVLDLEPRQAATASDRLEDGEVRFGDDHKARLSATHGTTSEAGDRALSPA
jgi:hypothetical protein